MKVAAAPVPSMLVKAAWAPASVVTTPAGVIMRTRQLLASVTKTLPAASTAMPRGKANSAAAPVPSALPDTLACPAIVVTTPAGVILRMTWPPSAT